MSNEIFFQCLSLKMLFKKWCIYVESTGQICSLDLVSRQFFFRWSSLFCCVAVLRGRKKYIQCSYLSKFCLLIFFTVLIFHLTELMLSYQYGHLYPMRRPIYGIFNNVFVQQSLLPIKNHCFTTSFLLTLICIEISTQF